MKKLLAITAAVLTSAGVTLLAVWPNNSTTSAHALTIERMIAASVEQWPEPGMCVLMEAALPESDAAILSQRPWEICHRVGQPESDDPRAYFATRVEVECRKAARDMCGLNTDAGVTVPPGMVVRASQAIIGAGCVDTPCVETQVRETACADWRTRSCSLAAECQP